MYRLSTFPAGATAVVVSTAALFAAGPRLHAQAPRRIDIDMTSGSTAAPDGVTVRIGTPMSIVVRKNPFQSCTADTKSEGVKPDTDALASLVGIAFALVGGARADVCPRRVEPPASVADAAAIDAQLTRAARDVSRLVIALQQRRNEYADLAAAVGALARCETPGACESTPAASAAARDLAKRIRSALDTPREIPATVGAQIDAAAKAITTKYGQIRDPLSPEGRWLDDASDRLACVQQREDAAAESRKVLSAAHDALGDAQKLLEAIPADTTMVVAVHPARQTTATVTISCVNAFTRQPVVYVPRSAAADLPQTEPRFVAPVSVAVTFRDPPRASVSAGVLVSTLGKRQLGTQPVKTGRDASGAVTFSTRIRETEASDTQLAPFSFLNYALVAGRNASLNAAAGIGLNPNSGSKQVEYFAGASVGLQGFFVELGYHIGRRQEPINGFAVGDLLPDRYPGVPFRREWRTRLAGALTYRIPLPK